MRSNWLLVGAAIGFLAVAAGAFGAHALRDSLSSEGVGWWRTAAEYQLIHAVALVVVGVLGRAEPPLTCLRVAGLGFTIGIVLFSGSLYALALTNVRSLGAVTPFGGALLLVGWGALAVAARRRPR